MTGGQRRGQPVRRALRPVTRPLKRAAWRAAVERDAFRHRSRTAELALFHDFAPPPGGGGHQALRAVVAEIERRGVRVTRNAIAPSTRACLFNSFNFDVRRLELMARRAPEGCLMVHRVGAVTTLYRGADDGTDAVVAEVNRRFADATLAISAATIEMYRSIGIELVDPRVVHNAYDPTIFHPRGRIPFDRGRTTRLISASWSDNPRKGAPTFGWLAKQLDPDRYELTFVGNSPVPLEGVRTLPPLPPHELADELRAHHVFFTATENDAYSNALVEALACGLPALYLDSGGSAEAVKEAGFAFSAREQIPGLLERLRDEYQDRRAAISLPTVEEVADGYLAVLGLDEFVR